MADQILSLIAILKHGFGLTTSFLFAFSSTKRLNGDCTVVIDIFRYGILSFVALFATSQLNHDEQALDGG